MLKWAVIFLIIALVAALFGFTDIASAYFSYFAGDGAILVKTFRNISRNLCICSI